MRTRVHACMRARVRARMGLLEVQDSLGQVDEAAADRSGSQKKVNEGELGGGGELSTVSFQYQNYCRKFDSTRPQK